MYASGPLNTLTGLIGLEGLLGFGGTLTQPSFETTIGIFWFLFNAEVSVG